MDRLTRQPCDHCGKDTLFKAITCTECGQIKKLGMNSKDIHRAYMRLPYDVKNQLEFQQHNNRVSRLARVKSAKDRKSCKSNGSGGFGSGRETYRVA